MSFAFEKMCGMNSESRPYMPVSNDFREDVRPKIVSVGTVKKLMSPESDDEIDEQYMPISDIFRKRVINFGKNIAKKIVNEGVSIVTIEKINEKKIMSFKNEEEEAYLLGYVQQYVWNLLNNKGMSGNVKQLENIVNVVKSIKNTSMAREH
jgi:hypothetical protein